MDPCIVSVSQFLLPYLDQDHLEALTFASIGLIKGSATAFTMIIRAAEIIVSSVGLAFLIKKGFNVMEEKFHPVK